MCYSKEASLTSFVTGVLLSLVLFQKGDACDKHIALFSLVFIQIQLAEYWMWRDQACGDTNHYATIYAHLVLTLQPVAILLGGVLFDTFAIPRRRLQWLLLLACIPVARVMLMYGAAKYGSQARLCSTPEIEPTTGQTTGHLNWGFYRHPEFGWDLFSGAVFFTGMFVPWLFLKDRRKATLSFALLFGSFILSRVDTDDISLKFKDWESRWCFLGVLMPVVFVLMI